MELLDTRKPGEAREAYLDRHSEEEQARILRTCEKLGPALTDPDWLIAESAQQAADRIEKAVGNISGTDELKAMFDNLAALIAARPVEAPPVTVQRSATIDALGIIALLVVALLSWFGSAAVTEARAHYANAAVAKVLTTPAGHAALRLIETNGDGLPPNLSRCRPYVEHGRKAMTCELWAEPAGGILRHDTPLSIAWEWLNALPTWPFLVIAIGALGALFLQRATLKRAVRVR